VLIDLLIDNPGYLPAWMPLGLLSAAAVYNVQNVSDYVRETVFDGELDKEVLVKFDEEIPNCAPLGEVTWFEWDGTRSDGGYQTTGCFLLSVDMHHLKDNDPEMNAFSRGRLEKEAAEQGVRWMCYQACFVRLTTAEIRTPSMAASPHMVVYLVAPDGHMVSNTAYEIGHNARSFWDENIHKLSDEDRSRRTGSDWCAGFTTMMATCFAHCKGVTMTTTEPTRHDRRRAERTGARCPMVFKVIDIRPAIRVIKEAGATGDGIHGVRWHRVRGHFVNYTAEAPLFGKHVGTYFKPAHVRGNLLKGMVEKRYRSHPEGDLETAEVR
jgi:hypothetical protein